MGKAIGVIKEGIGFVPNTTYATSEEITTVEFGEYAVALANSKQTLCKLKEVFNPLDAVSIRCDNSRGKKCWICYSCKQTQGKNF